MFWKPSLRRKSFNVQLLFFIFSNFNLQISGAIIGGNPKCNDGDDDKETIAPPTNGKQSERQMYTQQYVRIELAAN